MRRCTRMKTSAQTTRRHLASRNEKNDIRMALRLHHYNADCGLYNYHPIAVIDIPIIIDMCIAFIVFRLVIIMLFGLRTFFQFFTLSKLVLVTFNPNRYERFNFYAIIA